MLRTHPAKTWLKAVQLAASSYLEQLSLLIVPLACAGCDEPDLELCDTCATALVGTLHVAAADRSIVLGGTAFVGTNRNVIARWKDHGRSGLSPYLEGAARQIAVTSLAPALLRAVTSQGDRLPRSNMPLLARAVPAENGRAVSRTPIRILLVPMPSSTASSRERGFVPAHIVANGVCAGLTTPQLPTRVVGHLTLARTIANPNSRRIGPAPAPAPQTYGLSAKELRNPFVVEVSDGLTLVGKKQDQSQLGLGQRRANLAGKIQATPQLKAAVQGADCVVLVDDVVTTGATISEATRAISAGKGTIVCGFALMATPSSMPIAETA